MMGSARKELGAWGEEVATQYLMEKGYRILARNWKTKMGEVDIVAEDRVTIVFVEVKTRQSTRYGYAEEAVGFKKQQTLRQLARSYLRYTHQDGAHYRIDVIAIMPALVGAPPEIRHIIDAVGD